MKKAVLAVFQVFGYIVAWLAITVVIMGLTQMLVWDWESGGPLAELGGEGLLTTLGIAVTGVLIFLISRSPTVFAGWPDPKTGLRGFAWGALAGLGVAGSMLGLTIIIGGGSLVFEPAGLGGFLRYIVLLGICLLVASLAEEWLFRGYPLTKLAQAFGRGWANLVMALLFAGAHYTSNGFNGMVMFNIVLGSLMVGALRFTRFGIPAAWGAHFAWNFTQVLCGANLSLEDIDVPGVSFVPSGTDLVSGGIFGPEAGIAATVATLIFLILQGLYFRRSGARDLPIPFGRTPGQKLPH